MKLDVEGHEREALSGASRLIARYEPEIFIEIGRENCGALFNRSRRHGHHWIANIGKNHQFSRTMRDRWRLYP